MERDLSVGFYFYFSIAKFQALFLVEDPFKHVPPSWRRTLIDHLAPLLNGTGTSDAISIPGIAGAFCTPGLDKCWETSGMMHILGSKSPESLSDLCCVRKLLKMTIKLKTYIETRNSHGTNAGSHGSSDPKIQAWIWYGVFKEGDDHMISYDHFPRINIAMMNATNGCRWSFVTQFLFNQLGIKWSHGFPVSRIVFWIFDLTTVANIRVFCGQDAGMVYHDFHGIFSNFCTGISVSSQDTKSWEASMRCCPLGEPHAEVTEKSLKCWFQTLTVFQWLELNRWTVNHNTPKKVGTEIELVGLSDYQYSRYF